MRRPLQRNSLLTFAALLILLLWQGYAPHEPGTGDAPARGGHGESVLAAFEARRSALWLESGGHVARLLADDNDGSRHQRFILDVGRGHTVLVAHNIELAKRLPLTAGDELTLRGRYEWNERGGVIHWTHHDPANPASGGWIEHDGIRYR